MSDPAGLPAPARAFLDQAPDALLITESGPPGAGGKYPRVLLAVSDRAALRRLSRSGQVPREVRTATIGVWFDEATAALSYLPRPTPRAPSLTAIRSRAEGDGWLCVLRFDRPTSVGRVLEQLAQQSVALAVRVLPSAEVDLRVINPAGFDADASEPVVPASTLDLSRGVTEALVRSLRSALGVQLDVDPGPTARLALAAAGVPLVAADEDLDLSDRAAREEHSIRSRRRAIDELAPLETRPSVSIVMATRRPEMLEHAVGQVAHQLRVSELELVLAPHGFEPDVGRVRELTGPIASLQVVPQPESVVFGDVLNAAVAVAGGDLVLKMDDDDWYAPEFVADELRARLYSGADLVGAPDELYYLAERDLTVQRRHPGELYAQFVAGGTLLLARSLLRELGGFASVPRHVDRHLLDALDLAAATMYRTHGLGYVLRRNDSGHTYETDIEKILDPQQVIATWPGLRLGPFHDVTD
jgi:hypothetical protein